MLKIPISGGPHTGKTTLLEALRAEFPDAHFVPEPAERVIARELGKEQDDPEYTAIVPMRDYRKFAPLVVEESVALEDEIPEGVDVVFQDRSLIDNVGYGKLNDFTDFLPEVHRKIVVARYSFSLFCAPVGEYAKSAIRHETAEEAVETHRHLMDAYSQSGIEVVHLPAVAVEQRLEIIRLRIKNVQKASPTHTDFTGGQSASA